jgi:hypothetical protein
MGDTIQKRQRRNILRQRLDSYYEVLMQDAREQSTERWTRVLAEALLHQDGQQLQLQGGAGIKSSYRREAQ